MRPFRIAVIASIACAIPAAVLGAPPAAPNAPQATDPKNVIGVSEATQAIVSGSQKYVAKDFTGAVDDFRKATKLAPRNAMAHYLLGVAHLGAGALADAEAAFKQADDVGDATPPVKARALFALADIRERQKKWDDAKAAWQKYADYCAKHADAGYVQSGEARTTAIDDMLKQEKAYVTVRERIAADKPDAGVKK